MRRLVAALALLWPLPTWAETLPALFAVTGVAADDVLNIRAAPDAGAAAVGSFDPTRINIEVLDVSADGTWGMVGLPEGNGWVAMRFLERQEAVAGSIPHPSTCIGTEPFWTLGLVSRWLRIRDARLAHRTVVSRGKWWAPAALSPRWRGC